MRFVRAGPGMLAFVRPLAANAQIAPAYGPVTFLALRGGPVMADTVEKLLFRSYAKNSSLVAASLVLGRGGPCNLLLRNQDRSNERCDDSQNELSIPTHPHENSESLQFGVFQHGVIPGTGRHDWATRVCRCDVPVNREGERNERLCWIGHIAEAHFDLRG